MTESIVKDFKGKLDWVYVGKAEAPQPRETKADTILHEYMQRVFDVARPVAEIEIADVVETQGFLAEETTKQIIPEELQKFIKQPVALKNKWVGWEKKHSTPEHQNRLGKLLTSAVFMAGSFGLNYASERVAKWGLEGKNKLLFVSLAPNTGNKKMLEAGWQYLTDLGIEKAADHSAKWLTNREDIGFISPLSRTIGKIGNTVMSVTGLLEQHDPASMRLKSVLNPGFIEGAFRFAGSVPVLGFIKEVYGKANSQIMKGEGIIPLGADLAFNMMFAKFSGQMDRRNEIGGTPIPFSHMDGIPDIQITNE